MVYKHAVVAAFRINAQRVEDASKRGGWRPCINSHGYYIVDHVKSWKNHGIVCLNFCGNPAGGRVKYEYLSSNTNSLLHISYL